MNRWYTFTLAVALALAGCGAPAGKTTPQVLGVNASSAAQTWLSEAYDCTSGSSVLRLSDADRADLLLRLGEPEALRTPAFQIAVEQILVVVHPQTGVGPLSLEQARELFRGQASNWKEVGGNDLPVQVWVYADGEDIQRIFDQTLLGGQPYSSLARLAVSAQDMSDSVGNTPGSVGFLPRHWKAGNTREALTVASVPVLAVTKSEPQGALRELIACLQSRQ